LGHKELSVKTLSRGVFLWKVFSKEDLFFSKFSSISLLGTAICLHGVVYSTGYIVNYQKCDILEHSADMLYSGGEISPLTPLIFFIPPI